MLSGRTNARRKKLSTAMSSNSDPMPTPWLTTRRRPKMNGYQAGEGVGKGDNHFFVNPTFPVPLSFYTPSPHNWLEGVWWTPVCISTETPEEKKEIWQHNISLEWQPFNTLLVYTLQKFTGNLNGEELSIVFNEVQGECYRIYPIVSSTCRIGFSLLIKAPGNVFNLSIRWFGDFGYRSWDRQPMRPTLQSGSHFEKLSEWPRYQHVGLEGLP